MSVVLKIPVSKIGAVQEWIEENYPNSARIDEKSALLLLSDAFGNLANILDDVLGNKNILHPTFDLNSTVINVYFDDEDAAAECKLIFL